MLQLFMSPSKPSSGAFKLVSFVFTRCQVCGGSIEAHMRSPVSDPIRSLSEPCN
ncbi:unnamed protein product [Brassica napus]|uniref:(rape) hypothetical protein n=1 Tax=Brassica napus TaxID=3708 RepID=A0A816M9Y2_BRANA|nr:unnamed protein product [Brassica napus]